MADALADAGVDVAAWVPESRLDVSPCERSHALAVVLEDGLYYITGGQRLGSPTGFAAVAAALRRSPLRRPRRPRSCARRFA